MARAPLGRCTFSGARVKMVTLWSFAQKRLDKVLPSNPDPPAMRICMIASCLFGALIIIQRLCHG